ncbi:hypothetical protein EHQ27_06150 [Leptospira wolffii]|uniref:hypothetical protein n=1 Tax=Leptospira wolffii TaxID=409998 RepID=UPI001083E107|nr:hypothetical protein [Leptospira wolffii]TGK61775.1 hypothetical protein EHQ32_02665 [Leptospira wolffii]TGK70318.1 hypothetical protein EHQ35_18080 [Leptospira wolffii]TGK74937.1 hypothetical protein EHQ27_06150 [Leptospira wolffii]TGL30906.1 hypothetical protein EHQ57_05730 [Leptospira wolffii]
MKFFRSNFVLLCFPILLSIIFAFLFQKWRLNGPVLLSYDATFKYKQMLDYVDFGDFNFHYEYSEIDPEQNLIGHDWPIIIKTTDGIKKIAYPEVLAILLSVFHGFGLDYYIGFVSFFLLLIELVVFGHILRKYLGLENYWILLAQFLLAATTPNIAFIFQFHETSISDIFNIFALLFVLKHITSARKQIPALLLLSGLFFGIGALFRAEVIISAGVLMSVKSIFEFRKRSPKEIISDLAFFSLGFVISFGPYAIFNYLNSESIFGNRVYSTYLEQSSRLRIFSDLILGNFLSGRIVVGLLEQAPYVFLTPLLLLFKNEKPEAKLLMYHGVFTILLTAIVSPNNSWGAGWGIRYFCTGLPSLIAAFVLLVRNSLKERKYIHIALSSVLLAVSLYVSYYGLKIIKESMKNVKETQSIIQKAGDRMIFSSQDLFYYYAGIYIKDHTILQTQEGKFENYAFQRMLKVGPKNFCLHWSAFSPLPDEKLWATAKYELTETFDLELHHLRCFTKH